MIRATLSPKNILMIKAHSMGIGDLIRSSAAWAAMKARWPQANLHLLMLSTHPGYPIEQLLREHHLLDSALFISILEPQSKAGERRKKISFGALRQHVRRAVPHLSADLVIDFEPHGVRTAALSYWLGRLLGAPVVGIAQFPLRRFFYSIATPSNRSFAKKYGLPMPMDYTNRDFVVLDGLGIAREQRLPELKVSASGSAWAEKYLSADKKPFRVTLNIGCGTDGASPRRPPIDLVARALVELYRVRPFVLYLAGADFELDVNEAFTASFSSLLAGFGLVAEVINFAGTGTLSELTGLLAASDLVISSDSGPYHLAVALGRPTVCWFVLETPEAHHIRDNVKLLMNPEPVQLVEAVEQLFEKTHG